jgi:hypothetical protein
MAASGSSAHTSLHATPLASTRSQQSLAPRPASYWELRSLGYEPSLSRIPSSASLASIVYTVGTWGTQAISTTHAAPQASAARRGANLGRRGRATSQRVLVDPASGAAMLMLPVEVGAARRQHAGNNRASTMPEMSIAPASALDRRRHSVDTLVVGDPAASSYCIAPASFGPAGAGARLGGSALSVMSDAGGGDEAYTRQWRSASDPSEMLGREPGLQLRPAQQLQPGLRLSMLANGQVPIGDYAVMSGDGVGCGMGGASGGWLARMWRSIMRAASVPTPSQRMQSPLPNIKMPPPSQAAAGASVASRSHAVG